MAAYRAGMGAEVRRADGAEAVSALADWLEDADILWRARTWPRRAIRRVWRRLWRGERSTLGATSPRRAVPSRFIGARRDGSDLWLDTDLPGSMTFPVMVGGAMASFIAEDGAIPLARPAFGARVFHLHRITRADHLGPTEAEYREVADAGR